MLPVFFVREATSSKFKIIFIIVLEIDYLIFGFKY